MNPLRFTIITPTLLRPTLERTCKSIDDQTHSNYEHIIIVDVKGIIQRSKGLNSYDRKEYFKNKFALLDKISNKNRKILFYNKNFIGNDYGNECRGHGFDCRDKNTDYILYLDDDDFYINNTFSIIQSRLDNNKPNAFYFPCLRFNETFFNEPAITQTTSNQWGHKPVINGKEIKWHGDNSYVSDGEFLEEVKKIAGPFYKIDSVCLVQVNTASSGN